MAFAATGAEFLAERSPGSVAASLPTVFDDLTLTIERAAVPDGVDTAVVAGVWVGQLRRIGAAKLRYWGLSAQVDNAALLISELVTNALKHGKGAEVTFRLVLGTDRDIDLVVIEVDDGSPGRPEVHEVGPEQESGRGMFLVAATATSWGVSEDETKVWCVLASSAASRSGR